MRTVYQDDGYGCGAACFAMLTGLSYEQARQILFDGHRPSKDGIEREPILEELRVRSFKTGPTTRIRSGSIADLNGNALLHGWLMPSRGQITSDNRESHWLVWDGHEKVFRDPYRYKKPVWLTHFNTVERVT